MADEAVTIREINWREAFPFTHLFRAFRIAIHPSKLIIALVALGCLWCGGLVLDLLWPQKYQVNSTDRTALVVGSQSGVDRVRYQAMRAYADIQRRMGESPDVAVRTWELGEPASGIAGVFRTFWDYEITQANNVLMFRGAPFESTWNFVATGPLWLWSNHWFFALLYTLWFLLIWSVFGGAIARIAAVHVARDEKISVRHALSFSVAKVLSFIFAPVIPVFIVLAVGAVIALASTILLHIPLFGPPVAALLFFLALLGGFVVTLVLLGTIGGFNLMYPTIAVEGSDSFDAISRSFSYVFARPWRMLFYTLVAVVYGAICYLFVRFFVWMMLAVTWFFMTWFLGAHHVAPNDKSPADVFPRMWQQPVDPLSALPHSPQYELLKGTEAFAAGLIVWWVYLVIGLVGAFAISFYFSSNSIIYYLMRREVDATDLDDVYVEETDDDLDVGDAGPGEGAAVIATTTTVVTPDEVPPPPESEGGSGSGA